MTEQPLPDSAWANGSGPQTGGAQPQQPEQPPAWTFIASLDRTNTTPAAELASQVFGGEWRQMNYWERPDVIAQHYNEIQARPDFDWSSVGVDRDFVSQTYQYMQQQNSGKNWWDWKPLASNDPYLAMIGSAPEPSQDAKWEFSKLTGASKTLAQPTPTPTGLGGDSLAELPAWQKTMAFLTGNGLMSGITNALPWAAMGAASGAVVGGPLGAIVGGVGGLAAGAILGFTGDEDTQAWAKTRLLNAGYDPTFISGLQNTFNGALGLLNKPAEWMEQGIGTFTQFSEPWINYFGEAAAAGLTGDAQRATDALWNARAETYILLNELPAVWEASKLTYEAAGSTWLGGAVSSIPARLEYAVDKLTQAGGVPVAQDVQLAGEGQVYALGEAAPRTLERVGLGIVAAARNEIMAHPERTGEIVARYQNYTGFSGQFADMLYQSGADPLNLVPIGERAVIGKVGEMTGNPLLSLAARSAEGEGIIGTAKQYGAFLRAGAEGAPSPAAMTSVQRWLAGVTPGGVIKELQPGVKGAAARVGRGLFAFSENPLNPFTWWQSLNELTPKAKLSMFTGLAQENLGDLIKQHQGDIEGLVRDIQALSQSDLAGVAQIGKRLDNVEMYTIRQGMTGYAERLQQRASLWTMAEKQRQLVLQISEITGQDYNSVIHDLREAGQKGAARLQQQITNAIRQQNPSASILSDPGFTADGLKRAAQIFSTTPWVADPGHFHAALYLDMMNHLENWAVTAFKVKPEAGIFRANAAMKAAQSVLLLDFSPAYLTNNVVNNAITRAVDGVGGWIGPERTRDYLDWLGFPVAGLEGAGMFGEAKDAGPARYASLEEALQQGGSLAAMEYAVGEAARLGQDASKTKDLLDKIKNKMPTGPMRALSGRMETYDSIAAHYNGTMGAWSRLWNREGVIPEMPDVLRRGLANLDPRLPDLVMAAVEKSRTKGDLSKLVLGVEAMAARQSMAPYLPGAAQALGIPLGDVHAILNELNLMGKIDNALAQGATVADAFGAVERDIQQVMRQNLAKRLEVQAAQAEATARAEGLGGTVSAMRDVFWAHDEFWTRHFAEMERTFATADKLAGTPERTRVIREAMQRQNTEWRVHNAWTESLWSGMLRGLGFGDESRANRLNPDATRFMAEMTRTHDDWKRFYTERDRLYQDYYKVLNRTGQADYTALQKALGALYDAYTAREMDATRSMGLAFLDMWREQRGEANLGAVAYWWQGVVEATEKRQGLMRDFRGWERGETPVDPRVQEATAGYTYENRHDVWPRFLERAYLPAIGEITQGHLDGIQAAADAANGLPDRRDYGEALAFWEAERQRRQPQPPAPPAEPMPPAGPAPVEPAPIAPPAMAAEPIPPAQPEAVVAHPAQVGPDVAEVVERIESAAQVERAARAYGENARQVGRAQEQQAGLAAWNDPDARRQAMIEHFGFTPELADVETQLMERVAETWAQRTGRQTTEFWDYLAGIDQGSLPGEGQAQYQRAPEDNANVKAFRAKYQAAFESAYSIGVEARRAGIANMDELAYSDYFYKTDRMSVDELRFVEAGLRGAEMPYIVTAWRYGNVPESGRSYNYADDRPESGISVMEVAGGERTQDELSALFISQGRPRIEVIGYLNTFRKGSDGEPLLIAAENISAPLYQSAPAGSDTPRAALLVDNGRRIIRAIESADADSFLHESGHYYYDYALADGDRRAVQDYAVQSGYAEKYLRGMVGQKQNGQTVTQGMVDQALATRSGWLWKTATAEAFADGYVRFRATGEVSSPRVRPLFVQFRGWLRSILIEVGKKFSIPSPANWLPGEKLTPGMTDVYNRLFELAAWEQPIPADAAPDVIEAHRAEIGSALKRGLDVPAEVLAQYPDILAEQQQRLAGGASMSLAMAAAVGGTDGPRYLSDIHAPALVDVGWGRGIKGLMNAVNSDRRAAGLEPYKTAKDIPWVEAQDSLRRRVASENAGPFDRFMKTPIGLMPEALQRTVRGMANQLWSEMMTGENGRRIAINDPNSNVPYGEERVVINSTNPDWYVRLYNEEGLGKDALGRAFRAIVEGKAENVDNNNMRQAKAVIYERLRGYSDPVVGEVPGEIPLFMFLGEYDQAARLFADAMQRNNNQMTDEDIQSTVGDLTYLDTLYDYWPADDTQTLYQRGPKRVPGQMGMFDAGQDLPLFSGAAQGAQESVFNPGPTEQQLGLPGLEEPAPDVAPGIDATGTETQGLPLFGNPNILLQSQPTGGGSISVQRYLEPRTVAGMQVAGAAYVDGRFEAYIPYRVDISQPFDTAQGTARLLGIDADGNWLYLLEATGEIKHMPAQADQNLPLNGAFVPDGLGAQQAVPLDEGQVFTDGFDMHVRPLLDTLRRQMEQGLAVGTGGLDLARLTPGEQAALRGWVEDAAGNMSRAKMAAVRVGDIKKEMALLDYGKRYNFDNWLGLVYPYQFWFTRSMTNWSARFMDRPGMLAFYARMQEFLDEQDNPAFNVIPSRMRGKLRIPAPWLPDWAGGNLYVDPWGKLFPFREFTRPWEQYARDNTRLVRKAEQALREMADTGQITAQQAEAAMRDHAGAVWQKAFADAQLNEGGDLVDYMSLISGPSLAWSLVTRGPEGIGSTPLSRTLQALATVTGLEGLRSLDIEAALRKGAGINEFGEWGDYYIDRMLANLAADGAYTADEVTQAMIDRSGPVFDAALQRVRMEISMREPGMSAILATKNALTGDGNILDMLGAAVTAWLPGGLLPEGELKLRGLQAEYSAAWSAYHAGDKEAVNNFFEQHPEYNARLAFYDEPDERLRQFLTSNIWDRYSALSEPEQRAIEQQLPGFSRMFLNSETRDIAAVPVETLAGWSQAMGGYAPEGTQGPNVTMPSQNIIDAYQEYGDLLGQMFPGLDPILSKYWAADQDGKALLSQQFPALQQYFNFRDTYASQHPELIPYMIGQDNELQGASPEVQQQVYLFRAERARLFPDIQNVKNGYYALPAGTERKTYLRQHPELRQYWDWEAQVLKQMPGVTQYVKSDASAFRSMFGDSYTKQYGTPVNMSNWPAGLQVGLMQYFSYGRQLGEGQRSYLYLQWEQSGKPFGSFDRWMSSLGTMWGQ